jgi:hypothetical protein
MDLFNFRLEGLISGQIWIPSEEYTGHFLFNMPVTPYIASGQYFPSFGDGGRWSLSLQEYLY